MKPTKNAMSDKSINNTINSESATLEAFKKWKENTSYSEEIKKKVEDTLNIIDIEFEENGQPINAGSVLDRFAHNDFLAKKIEKTGETRKKSFIKPPTQDEVTKDRREAEKLFEEAVDRSSFNTKAPLLKSERYQIQVPSGLDMLIQSASAAQGRSAPSFALYALEVGLNQLLNNGLIPKIAEKKYQAHCEMLAALGDVKAIFKNIGEFNPYFEEGSCF